MNPEAQFILDDALFRGDALKLDLWYPNIDTRPVKAFEIGLTSVRAATDIRVEFDFERDGWVISRRIEKEGPIEEGDEPGRWDEAAFIPGSIEEEGGAS